MPLRKGDTVSLSVRPAVALTRYQHLKATATLTRTLGDDPESDVQDMRDELRRLYFAAVHDDLTLMGELTQLVREDGQTDKIAAYALKHSKPHATVQAPGAPRRAPKRV
jgi:hypothetical protein